jgi:tRNA(adenine34) deaminase
MTEETRQTDLKFMELALEAAKEAAQNDEVPIGAILVDASGAILSTTGNRTITLSDPTAHAEILAIRAACGVANSQRIPGTTLYVTLEPCAMCAAAISFARISRIVFAAPDPKGGGVMHGGKFFTQPTCHHRPDITDGIMAEESAELLKGFFKEKRLRG